LSSDFGSGRSGEGDSEPDVIIGRVSSVNIPKRQLRIAKETSHPERFKELDELRLRPKRGSAAGPAGGDSVQTREIVLAIVGVRITEKAIIVNLGGGRGDGVDGNLIASLRGAEVIVKHSERYPLPPDEYYIDDLVGLTVKDKDGGVIGILREVWETPANAIYQVLGEGGEEVLLPAVEDVILSVDIEGGEIIADISNLV
jgi:16S rRNA processing protein RimM